jgi:hypothetical protein
VPLDWATTQNNLGAALAVIGERESGTAHLTEAVAAFRAALEERARDRVLVLSVLMAAEDRSYRTRGCQPIESL